MNVELHPDQITPLHAPRIRRLLAELTKSMKAEGWKGRPLLVIERADDYLAWTGSHRVAAAQRANLDAVPCYAIKERELQRRGFDAEHGHVVDSERLDILAKLGDEEALQLMWAEGRQ